MPKISVIMPAFNTEKYIADAIDSVLRQTFADWELIIVDDGGPDKVAEIAEKYAAKDKRIKLIRQKNAGQAAARNNALKIARGEYVGFVDSDDTIDSDFYEKLMRAAKISGADIAMAGMRIIDGATTIEYPALFGTAADFADKIAAFPNGSCCDKIFRTEIIKENGIEFPTGLYYEDTAFLIVAAYDANMIVPADTFYNYHVRGHSTTTIENAKMITKRDRDRIAVAGCVLDFAYGAARDKRTRDMINQFVAQRSVFVKLPRRPTHEMKRALPHGFIRWAYPNKFLKFFYDDAVRKNGVRKIKILKIPVFVKKPKVCDHA